MKIANQQLTKLIRAAETKNGQTYRLLKNHIRSRDLVVTGLGISPKGNPLFVYHDVDNNTTLLLNDVAIDEFVQIV